MPSTHPRGTETMADRFEVEPSYASGSTDIYLTLKTRGSWRIEVLTREEAQALVQALNKVLQYKPGGR